MTQPAARSDPSRRNVLILAIAQAIGQTMLSASIVVTALVGHDLATDKSLATLPLALQFTAVMAATVPASLLMRAIGRRAGFTIGAVAGILGGLVAALAIRQDSLALFAGGSMLLGVHAAFVQYYRFAAADTASASFRPRAVSLVLAGGVVAAVAGAELAKWSRDLVPDQLFAGCYLAMAVLAGLAVLVLQFVDIPRLSAAERASSGRPLAEIVRQPAFPVAVLAAAVGYGVMSLVMTATPLAMTHHHFAFDDTAFVIQWHALAMFVPSFFTGRLIQRFGAADVIIAGGLLNLLSLAVNLAGLAYLNFWTGLLLLGLGWNFMFVGGTALLAGLHRPEERGKVQALNEFLVFSTVALASFSSGALQSSFGWHAVNLGVVPPLGIALLAAVWLRLRRRDAVPA